MKYLKIIFIINMVVITTVACTRGAKEDYGSKYQQGGSMPSLKMPQGVQQQPVDPYYQVPAGPGDGTVDKISIIPPGSVMEQQLQAKQSSNTKTAVNNAKTK